MDARRRAAGRRQHRRPRRRRCSPPTTASTGSASVHIDKAIPVAGGMAGGSADAAAALVALDRLWELRHLRRRPARARRPARQRRAVRAARRHRARHRPRRAGRAGRRPRHLVVGRWCRRRSGCPRRRSTGTSTGCSPTPRPSRSRPTRCSRARRRRRRGRSPTRCTTTCRPPRSTCAPSSAELIEAGRGRRCAARDRLRLRPDLRVPLRVRRPRPRACPPTCAGAGHAVVLAANGAGRRRPHWCPMPNLLNLERVSKSYGVRPLLTDVSLGIGAGERIGIVGRNGDGKTTLLEVMTGLEEPDTGRVSQQRGLLIGYLHQGDELDDTHTVREAVLGGRSDHEWAADSGCARSSRCCSPGSRSTAPVIGLSGGERRRCSLAALLLGDHDLIVLDEPTNHLDVEAVAWLAQHLVKRAVRAGRRHPRPLVPRRGLPVDVGGPRRRRRRLRGRLRRVRAGQGRAVRARRRPPRCAGRTWPARSWPGCAAARRPGPRSRSSASTPPTR